MMKLVGLHDQIYRRAEQNKTLFHSLSPSYWRRCTLSLDISVYTHRRGMLSSLRGIFFTSLQFPFSAIAEALWIHGDFVEWQRHVELLRFRSNQWKKHIEPLNDTVFLRRRDKPSTLCSRVESSVLFKWRVEVSDFWRRQRSSLGYHPLGV